MIIYNKIGKGYTAHRRADSRIVDAIFRLLNLSGTDLVVDVGAGTGNYSNALADKGLSIFALEPSKEMLSQAKFRQNVKWLQGIAENIPIQENVVKGIVAILSIHHFRSMEKASAEFCRICKNGSMVLFTFDPRHASKFWLANYFPSIWNSAYSAFPPVENIAKTFACNDWRYKIECFPLPSDLSDKFMAYGWKNPEVYLDDTIRNSMSGFALEDQLIVNNGIAQLKDDLETGSWDKKYGAIKEMNEIDLGYRLLKFHK